MSDERLARLRVIPLGGSEPFRLGGQPAGFTVLDFWRWSTSDLVSNSTRGVLAEYIVATALGLQTDCARMEWDRCDLVTRSGLKVEVKSAAYLQTWGQQRLSRISFSVAPRLWWDAATNTYAAVAERSADVYVFALLAHQDKATVNALDLDQWRFWAVPTHRLKDRRTDSKSISLAALQGLAGDAIAFADLKDLVDRVTAAQGT
jgi:hypothetical protein